jgi:hypothetical protein
MNKNKRRMTLVELDPLEISLPLSAWESEQTYADDLTQPNLIALMLRDQRTAAFGQRAEGLITGYRP